MTLSSVASGVSKHSAMEEFVEMAIQFIERRRLIAMVLITAFGLNVGIPTCVAEKDAAATVHTLRFFSKENKAEEGWCMAFSPDSQEILISTTAGSTSCIRVSDANPFARFNLAARGIRFTEDGKSIVLMSPNNLLFVDRTTRQARVPEQPKSERGFIGLALQGKNERVLVESVPPVSPTERDVRFQ